MMMPLNLKLEELQRSSALRFFPEIAKALVEGSKIVHAAADFELVVQGQEPSGVFISLQTKVKRFLEIGRNGERVQAATLGPFELIGLVENLQGQPFAVSYQTEESSDFIFLPKEIVELNLTDSKVCQQLRLLNSSVALRHFFCFCLDHGVPLTTVLAMLDHVQPKVSIFSRGETVNLERGLIYFLQNGSLMGLETKDKEQKFFSIETGDWFGPGLYESSQSTNLSLSAQRATYFHTFDLKKIENRVGSDLLNRIRSEPCLGRSTPLFSSDSNRAPESLKAKLLSPAKMRYFQFHGDVNRLRFGQFPVSPFHATLWNLLLLHGQDLQDDFVSQTQPGQEKIRFSHFASILEGYGLMTQLRKWSHHHEVAILEKSLIYFMGRPVILLAVGKKFVFLFDPVFGMMSLSTPHFLAKWNRRLLEVNSSPLESALGDQAKTILDKPEVAGRKILDYFLSGSKAEMKNLFTFKLFQCLLILVVPTFFVGLIQQSLGRASMALIYTYYLGVFLFLLFHAISLFSSVYYSSEIMAQFRMRAQSYFYKLFLGLPGGANSTSRAGVLTMRLSLFEFAFSAIKFEKNDLVIQTILILSLMVLLGATSWIASFGICIISVTALAVVYYFRKKGGFSEINTATQQQDLIDQFVELTSGAKTLRVNGAIDVAKERLKQATLLLGQGTGEYAQALTSISERGVLIFRLGGVILIYVLMKGIIEHRASPAELFGFVLYLSYLNAPYSQISSYITNFNTLGLFSMIGQIARVDFQDGNKVHCNAQLRGKIQFDKVSYRYTDRSPFSIIECSFSVKPGELVAIVGRSGSGKSTLARLLARQIEPGVGRVLFDGVDSRVMQPASLQSQIGFVPQTPSLFSGSIESNISFGEDDFDRDRIRRIARSTRAHEFIKGLPSDYSYRLREFGIGLSSGQRQMVAFSRVLYGNPKILILDEVTAHLDPKLEGFVTGRVFEGQEQRTTFMVVHKISIAQKADRILVLKQGRIVEEGDHNHLLALGGEYSELYRYQVSDE